MKKKSFYISVGGLNSPRSPQIHYYCNCCKKSEVYSTDLRYSSLALLDYLFFLFLSFRTTC